MRVLSWNLYHGRDFPPADGVAAGTHVDVNRPLRKEFAGWIAERDWDVAFLQEAPPLWFRALGDRSRSNGVRVLTSRNVLLPLQRLLADLSPDLIKSWEGGSNQLFVRSPGRVVEHRSMTLTRRPERRRMVWARVLLPDGGTVSFANLHASAGLPDRASAEVIAAAANAVEWSGPDPLVFGGDMNLRPARDPGPFAELRERFGLGDPTEPHAIDHLLSRGLDVAERPRRLPAEERELPDRGGRRIRLSDHAPVVAAYEVK
jgi:endonuclease/exonuclease/phosphatase family metal-dependent hydrolase